MRYCCRCGYIIDEYDVKRERSNCGYCGYFVSEDNMTALKFAQLTEEEKDAYAQQLFDFIKDSASFDKKYHDQLLSVNGGCWRGFRPDKYLQQATHLSKKNIKWYLKSRKANEPYKPFSPIDPEEAQRAYEKAEREHSIWGHVPGSSSYNSQASKQENSPKCPTCSSTSLRRISTTAKVANTAIFGIFGTKRHKTFHCNSCGYEW